MATELPLQFGERKSFAGVAQGAHEVIDPVGAHYWLLDRAIPFGGHWLIECACGCFGPFVLCVEDALRVRCAVALALSEGAARRALCGDATVDLRERDRAIAERSI